MISDGREGSIFGSRPGILRSRKRIRDVMNKTGTIDARGQRTSARGEP